MSIITSELIKNADSDYKSFQSKLIPTVDADTVLGVRAPVCRKIAKKYACSGEGERFLFALPHTYYDENITHGYMLGLLDTEKALSHIKAFLSYMDNWAVVDMTVSCLKKFFSDRAKRLDFVKECLASSEEYTVRFGIVSLMAYYLDNDNAKESISLVKQIRSDKFYVKMAQAWFFATALTKQYTLAVPIIENGALDTWTHNKAIQKARESLCIPKDKKDYLKTLKRGKDK